MTGHLRSDTTNPSAAPAVNGDVEYEISALASRHRLSLDEARAIVEKCGGNLDCIDDEARKLRLAS